MISGVGLMKTKIAIISNNKAYQWCTIANLLAKSQFPFSQAIKQFNQLGNNERIEIKKKIEKYDEIRRMKIPREDQDEVIWLMNSLVDLHIVATEYGIDPLTAALCINPPCRIFEKVVVR